MNLNAETPLAIGIKQGLIMGIFGSLASILPIVVDYQPWWFGFSSFAILVWLCCEAIKKVRKAQNGYISVSQGFKTGTWAWLIASVIISVVMYVYRLFWPDTKMDQILELQREAMEQQGKISAAQIDQVIGMVENLTLPINLLWISIISYLLLGMLVSIIAASVLKKEKSIFD